MRVMNRNRKLLEKYITSDAERPNGDLDAHCPVHEDERRSATINFRTNEWYCNTCEEGGSITELVSRRSEWVPVPTASPANGPASGDQAELPDPARLDGWSSALLANEGAREYLTDRRGLTLETIGLYGIGWHSGRYTFPIYDEKRKLANVRMYDKAPTDDKPKWINWPGWGSPPRIYPLSVLREDPSTILLAEGELDTLLANQHGIPAVTSTGGVKSMGRWRQDWNPWFEGRDVHICFDRDGEGEQAAKRVGAALADVAKSVHILRLPYPAESRKDLTDFILDGHTAEELFALSKKEARKRRPKFRDVSYDTLRHGKMEGRPVVVQGTMSSINSTQELLPRSLVGKCAVDWDPKRCKHCPCGERGGTMRQDVSGAYKLRLELLGTGSDRARESLLKEQMGIPKGCPQVDILPEYSSYWECEIRNGSNVTEEAYPVLLKLDGAPPQLNSLYNFEGRLRPSPRGQRAIFDAEKADPANQDIDSFEPDPEASRAAHEWVDSMGKNSEEQIENIAENLELHVTRIYGQRLLHIGIDLVYHSVLAFKFGGDDLLRGWMEVLAVGDTRSGKSTAAKRINTLYGRGHYEAVENASIAGLVYGAEKRASGVWQGAIGILPLNDRGLVVLDEAQGLTKEQIGQMSAMRSDGIVKMTKIRQATCNARVRLIWMANGRKKRYANGMECLQDLMGQPEDLARVDLPLYVGEDIGDELIKARTDHGPLPNREREIMRWILLWAWSRRPEHVRWSPEAKEAVWDLSENLSEQYSVTDTPIFTRNEASVRLARLAVAIAARLFSSPDGEALSIRVGHVLTAERIYDRFLGSDALELVDLKAEEDDRKEAGHTNSDELLDTFTRMPPDLVQKIASGQFTTRGMSYEQTAAYGGPLYNMQAIVVQGDDATVSPWAQTLAKEYMRQKR